MNNIRITYEYHMCYCCKCDANAMQGERIERKGDISICDILRYRDIERLGVRATGKLENREIGRSGVRATGKPGDREIGRLGDREIGRSGDREQKSAGGWKVNNRVSIANAPK